MTRVTYHGVTCDPDKDGILLRKLAGIPAEKSSRLFLLILSGLPASGKSHFARYFAKRSGAAVLEADELRKQMFKEPAYSPEESTRFFLALYNLKDRLLSEGYAVIMDSTNVYEILREDLFQSGVRLGIPTAVAYFEVSEEETKERMRKRSSEQSFSDADWQVYLKLREKSDYPSEKWLQVDSTLESVDKTAARIEKALFYE